MVTRTDYESDESSLGPYVRVYWSIRNPANPDQVRVFASPELRGIWVGLLLIAISAHAGKTGNQVTISGADLHWITGRKQYPQQLAALSRVTSPLGYELREMRGGAAQVHIPNFARDQGLVRTAPGERRQSRSVGVDEARAIAADRIARIARLFGAPS
jgi:hypothetical protein